MDAVNPVLAHKVGLTAPVADYADPDGDMQNDQPDFASADLELEAQPAFIPPDLSDT